MGLLFYCLNRQLDREKAEESKKRISSKQKMSAVVITQQTTVETLDTTTKNHDNSYDSILPENVGHLLDEPFEFVCPACHQKCRTRVVYEAVTCLQKFIAILNFCLCCKPIKWSGRHDVNHYCSKCGCYIGRKITLSWYQRQLFKIQNAEVEQTGKLQRFHKILKEELDLNKQKHKNENNKEEEDGAQEIRQ